eukprot:1754780-Prymnesium_polylepis.1
MLFDTAREPDKTSLECPEPRRYVCVCVLTGYEDEAREHGTCAGRVRMLMLARVCEVSPRVHASPSEARRM